MITAASQSAGIPLDALPCVTSRVDPFGHLLFEWIAFGALSTDRQVGMERGPVPWSSIHSYALRYGIEGDDFDRLCFLIRAMDQAYLEYFRKKSADAQR